MSLVAPVCSVVVCYHPEPDFRRLLGSLRAASDHVIVVDNTPGAMSCGESQADVTTLAAGRNEGLARALNRGVAEARRRGAATVVLWDQDSRPTTGTYAELSKAPDTRVGPTILSACAVDPTISEDESTAPYRVDRAITSGLSVPCEVFDRIGGFREDFRVDMVDFDFTLRALGAGVEIVRVPTARFAHRLGDPDAARVALGRFRSSGHPPWRHYWIARNSSVLLREHRGHLPSATRALAKDRLYWFINAVVAGPRRAATVRALLEGLRDGRSGRVSAKYAGHFDPLLPG